MGKHKILREYEVSLVRAVNKIQPERMMVYIPAPIARALNTEGYTHAKLTFDEDGIHLRPVKSVRTTRNETVVLPNWENNGA